MLFYYDDEPDVSDEEKVMDSDENAQLERAIVSAARHHGGEKGKNDDLSDVESMGSGNGERTVQGGGDDDERDYKGVVVRVGKVLMVKGLYKGVVMRIGEVLVMKGLYKGW